MLRERPQGSWEPQRSNAIGVRSHLEGFSGAGGSWIAGRGDLQQVLPPVENFINARWVYNQKAGEYGWPTTTTTKPVSRGNQQIMGIDFG